MSWVPASHNLELERLNQLLWHYETVNLDQKGYLELSETTRSLHVQRIQDLEKQLKAANKKVKTLEVALKFEKTACEGIRKRSNTFEADLNELKLDHNNLKDKHDFYYKQNQDFQQTFLHERTTRLQLLHEKDKLSHQYQDLLQKFNQLESEMINLKKKYVKKLENIEILIQKVMKKDQLIVLQSQDLQELNQEIIQLHELQQYLNNIVVTNDSKQTNNLQIIDVMSQEISYLRKELITNANDQTGRSYSSYQPFNDGQQFKQITNKVNNITANRYDREHILQTSMTSNLPDFLHQESSETNLNSPIDYPDQQSSFLSSSKTLPYLPENPSTVSTRKLHSSQQPERCLSPLATTRRPQDSLDYSRGPTRTGLRSESLTSANLPTTSASTSSIVTVPMTSSEYFKNPERLEMLDWIKNSNKRFVSSSQSQRQATSFDSQHATKTPIKESVERIQKCYDKVEETNGKNKSKSKFVPKVSERLTDTKSMFVGSGLHLKQNEELNQQLKTLQQGSTKDILKKILQKEQSSKDLFGE